MARPGESIALLGAPGATVAVAQLIRGTRDRPYPSGSERVLAPAASRRAVERPWVLL